MVIPTLHPIYAAASIGILIVFADVLRRVIPFYRHQLQMEAVTRSTPLDGLRGLLCFSVMYHHAAITHAFLITGRWEETPSMFYVLLGQTSVAMFFCITAYLFWGRALVREGDIPPWPFLRGRWFRIVPLYAFTCFAALCLAHRHIHWHSPDTLQGLGLMGLMGLRSWGKLGDVDINMINAGVTWTLQYEWTFYFALPALAMLVRGGQGWRITFLIAAWCVMFGWDQSMDASVFFLTGILAAHVARWPQVAVILRTHYIGLMVMAIGVVMPLLVSGGYTWLALLLTTLIFVPIACGNSLFGILNLPGLRMMGMVSYSVYLLHGMFLYKGRSLLHQTLRHGDLVYWATVLAIACIVLIFCSITYRLIEWPSIALEKRWRRAAGGPARR